MKQLILSSLRLNRDEYRAQKKFIGAIIVKKKQHNSTLSRFFILLFLFSCDSQTRLRSMHREITLIFHEKTAHYVLHFTSLHKL